jgi:chemotaxis protein MotA
MSAIIGLFSAFGLIIAAMAINGTMGAFVNIAGMLIVIFGTAAVTAISFSGRELLEAPKTVWRVISKDLLNPTDAAFQIIQMAEKARKNGVLLLEKQILKSKTDPFFVKGIQLVVDGTNGAEVEQIMHREAGTIQSRNLRSVDVLRRAGEVAPAMGLIGTLVGLIQMLGSLDDPSSIGSAMAVALLTTFYGAILAHMVFIPLAARIERVSAEQALLNSVYALGASSIGREENPRRLEIMVNTILPPERKVKYFDKTAE